MRRGERYIFIPEGEIIVRYPSGVKPRKGSKTFGIYGDPGRYDAMMQVRQGGQLHGSMKTDALEKVSRARRGVGAQPTFGIYGDPGR